LKSFRAPFYILIILITLVGCITPAHGQQNFFGAATGAIHYMGRTQRGDTVLWTWPGSGLRVIYSGSRAVLLRFRAENFGEVSSQDRVRNVWYRIDGAAWTLLSIPPNTDNAYPLTAPPDTGRHILEVVKASEGQLTFVGLILEPGGKLARPPVPGRRIEIIGDSITVGYKINGSGSYETPGDHDARATYGWLLSEKLNAEVRLIGITGYGVVHNYGTAPDQSRAMPAFYPELHRGYPTPNDWSWQPQTIIINLGTNDLGPPAPTDPGTFQSAYTNLLAVVRKFNPRATIFALQPFGISDGALAVYPNEIRAAVEAHRQAGDTRVIYVDTAGWLGTGDFTDGVHPNPNGNRKAADKLAERILNMPAAANPGALAAPPIRIPVDINRVA
jgi:lysophospholipase L1-like esterase